jgi:mannose-6-phosphate isomerase-like protein (cupin superfamily)
MTDPRSAPFGAVRLADVLRATDIDPDYPDATDGEGAGARDFHLVRRHFDIRAFGVNGITGHAGDEMVEPHDERDDEANQTDGHEELFAVMSGHAVFTVDGEELDAPAGTLVFVRDPHLIRSARATVDGTAILAIGGRPGVPFAVSRWERAWFPVTAGV